jgi:hypothetical protein
MQNDPHTAFIVAAYAVATTVILSMIVAIVSDHLALKRSLRRFGARGTDRT